MTKPKAARVWDRADDEWYVEPQRVTLQLASVESFTGRIHDPCCGQGNIVEALQACGYDATGSDLRQRVTAPWHLGTADFMTNPDPLYGARHCVFNPPYFKAKGTESFIRRAVAVTPGKVCAFTETRFLGGVGRAQGIYADLPPDRVYIVTPRPSCPPGEFLRAGGEAQGGTSDFIWLVWDERRGDTRLMWLTW